MSQFLRDQASDSDEVVTPLMLDGTYLSRNFATLGPLTWQPPSCSFVLSWAAVRLTVLRDRAGYYLHDSTAKIRLLELICWVVKVIARQDIGCPVPFVVLSFYQQLFYSVDKRLWKKIAVDRRTGQDWRRDTVVPGEPGVAFDIPLTLNHWGTNRLWNPDWHKETGL